jgi:endogenous inhibitor of DNA gyrase (YacG/DUF329 family)
MPRCPTCRAEVKVRSENAAFPFCSPRCKAIDLGKWFTDAYRVPGPPASVEPPPPEEDDDQQ